MAFSQTENFSQPFLEESGRLLPEFLLKIKERVRSFFWIHFSFIALASIELLFFFSSLLRSPLHREAPFLLALFFATLFCYLVLRLYFATKKEQQLIELALEFLEDAKRRMHFQEGNLEHHLIAASLAKRAALWLEDREYTLYDAPRFLSEQKELFENVSAFLAWKSCLNLREQLLHLAIGEHIKAVKIAPTSIECHILLASAYVMLSGLYSPQTKEVEGRWIARMRFGQQSLEKFKEITKFAIEEFTILETYAPQDPWIHHQLATHYHSLGLIDEEIAEYELLQNLQPGDSEILMKLGILYFRQNKNAKALGIHEKLRQIDSSKAQGLIDLYSSL